MGAYENPPIIQNTTSSAGAAWANAAASIGKNIGAAVVERKKYLDAELEKEQKEMLAIRKQRVALGAQGAKELKANLEKMKGLDKEFQEAYIKEFNAGWDVYTRSQTATSVEEIEALKPQLEKFNQFKAKAGTQIQSTNDYTIKMAKFIDQVAIDGPGVPNTVDLYYGGNLNLMRAANIETGGITEGESREMFINDKGDSVLKYTFKNEDGKTETFELNAAELELDNVLQVPDINNLSKGIIDKSNIFAEDGSLNPEYTVMGEDNQPEMNIDVQYKNGQVITTQSQMVKSDDIVKQFTDAGINAANGLSYEQKVSIWKNTIAPSLKDYELSSLNYDSKTGEFSKAEQELFSEGLGKYMANMATQRIAEATKSSYKVSTTKDTRSVEDQKNTRLDVLSDAFNTGKTFVSPGSSFKLETITSKKYAKIKAEEKSEKPEEQKADTAGWFVDPTTGNYFRVIDKTGTVVDTVTNKMEAFQHFAVLDEPKGVNQTFNSGN